jgi:hypothetical protein
MEGKLFARANNPRRVATRRSDAFDVGARCRNKWFFGRVIGFHQASAVAIATSSSIVCANIRRWRW